MTPSIQRHPSRHKVVVLAHGCLPAAENHIWNSKDRIVYGPVCSRRWRYSLGINLFPGQKVCSLNCTYCDMGRTLCGRPDQTSGSRLLTPDEVVRDLRRRWLEMREAGQTIDVVTVCGNGEATLHPDFLAIVVALKREIRRLDPAMPFALMTNSTTVFMPSVQESLHLFDRRVFKMDAGDPDTYAQVCRPLPTSPSFTNVIEGLVEISHKVHGGIVVSAAAVSSEARHYGNLQYEDALKLEAELPVPVPQRAELVRRQAYQ